MGQGVIPQIYANVNRGYGDGQAVNPLLPSRTPSSPELGWPGVTPGGRRALARLGGGCLGPLFPGGSAHRCGAPWSSAALLCPLATHHQDGEPQAAAAFGGHRGGCQHGLYPGKVSVPADCFLGVA